VFILAQASFPEVHFSARTCQPIADWMTFASGVWAVAQTIQAVTAQAASMTSGAAVRASGNSIDAPRSGRALAIGRDRKPCSCDSQSASKWLSTPLIGFAMRATTSL
jgi:hypothetical protein